VTASSSHQVGIKRGGSRNPRRAPAEATRDRATLADLMSYLDSIPQAVATIVAAYITTIGRPKDVDGVDALEKRVVSLTEQLTRVLETTLKE
jgi:hypothetical protein